MDLNTVDVAVLTKIVGLSKAYHLILWRPYLSWDEVAEVADMDEAALAALRAAGAQIKLPGDPVTLRDIRNLPPRPELGR
jgi:DNA uptake protein ComE-like DNA-binding protein